MKDREQVACWSTGLERISQGLGDRETDCTHQIVLHWAMQPGCGFLQSLDADFPTRWRADGCVLLRLRHTRKKLTIRETHTHNTYTNTIHIHRPHTFQYILHIHIPYIQHTHHKYYTHTHTQTTYMPYIPYTHTSYTIYRPNKQHTTYV